MTLTFSPQMTCMSKGHFPNTGRIGRITQHAINIRMTRKGNVSPFNDLATTSTAHVTADERASGKILAENLMENIKKIDYISLYDVTVPNVFAGDSAAVTVQNIRNNNIQQIFITVERHNHQVLTLESYKVNRQ